MTQYDDALKVELAKSGDSMTLFERVKNKCMADHAERLAASADTDENRRKWKIDKKLHKLIPENYSHVKESMFPTFREKYANVIESGKGFLISGTVGVGKTFLATLALRMFCEIHDTCNVCWISADRVSQMVASADFEQKKKLGYLTDNAQRARCVLIDDIYSSKKGVDDITSIIKELHDKCKFMIVTSNLGLNGEVVRGKKKEGIFDVAPQTADRLRMLEQVVFTGKSRR